MEAKDTILSIPQGTEPQTEICRRCAYMQAQAEYSFKAGIKEVVEWIHTEFGGYIPDFKGGSGLVLKNILIDEEYGEDGSMDKWQAKLKEWGVYTDEHSSS